MEWRSRDWEAGLISHIWLKTKVIPAMEMEIPQRARLDAPYLMGQ